jgi:hypothetical protein
MNLSAQVFGLRVMAILGPILILLGFQLVAFEPATAHASNTDLQFLPLPVVPQIEEPEVEGELSVREYSPFWYEEVEHSLPEMPEAQLPEEPMHDPDPIFVLSSVLPSANKSFAVINGKPYSEGDTVAEGWTLVKIAGQERYIIVKHESGRRLRVMMSRN